MNITNNLYPLTAPVLSDDKSFNPNWPARILFSNSIDISGGSYGLDANSSLNIISKWNTLSATSSPYIYNANTYNLLFNTKQSYIDSSYNSNNSFYKLFYEEEINKVLDNNCSKLSCKAYLTTDDLYQLDFAATIQINENYYILNKVVFKNNDFSELELIKINYYSLDPSNYISNDLITKTSYITNSGSVATSAGSSSSSSSSYSLPTASTTVLGGVKLGTTVKITGDVLDVSITTSGVAQSYIDASLKTVWQGITETSTRLSSVGGGAGVGEVSTRLNTLLLKTNAIDTSVGNILLKTNSIDSSLGKVDISLNRTFFAVIETSTRLNTLLLKTNAIDSSIGGVVSKVNAIDSSVGLVVLKVNAIDASLGRTFIAVGEVSTRLSSVGGTAGVGEVSTRLNTLLLKTNAIDSSIGNILLKVNAIDTSIGLVVSKVNAIDSSLGKVDISLNRTFFGVIETSTRLNTLLLKTNAIDSSIGNILLKVNAIDSSVGLVVLKVNAIDASLGRTFIAVGEVSTRLKLIMDASLVTAWRGITETSTRLNTQITEVSTRIGGGSGNVSNIGTPLAKRVAIWTDSTHIRGDASLYYDEATGYFGAGTTNPQYALDVSGQTRTSGGIIVGDWNYVIGGGNLKIQGGPGSSSTIYMQETGGNIAIGKSSTSYSLDVSGSIRAHNLILNASINMQMNKISNLGNPASSSDALNLGYASLLYAAKTPVNTTKTTNYNIQTTDFGNILEASGTITFYLIYGSSYEQLVFVNVGNGILTISPSTGYGGAIRGVGTKLKNKWGACTAYYNDGINAWTLIGDVST